MLKTRRRLAVGAVLTAAAAGAYGQTAEATVSFGASIITNKAVGQIEVEGSGFRLGGRFNFNQGRFLGHEIGVGYNRTSLAVGPDKSGMSMIQVFYDFLLHALPEGSAVRPFVCGGGGFSSFYPPGTSVSTGGFTKFGYNYGAGVKFKVSEKYGMRLDLRDYVTGKPFGNFADVRGRLHAIEMSAGFGIVF